MAELYEVVSGFLPASIDISSSSSSSSSSFTTAPTPVGAFRPDVTPRFPPPATPTIPRASLNINNQMLGEHWDMYAMGNLGFDQQISVGPSSFATDTPTTFVTTPTIPTSFNFNNQRLHDWDIYAMANHRFPPHTINNNYNLLAASSSSSSSSSFATTTFINPTTTTFIPTTITTSLGIPLNSGQTWVDAINLDLYEIANGFSSSTTSFATTTYIPTNINSQTYNLDVNHNWINRRQQQHFSSATSTIFGSSSNIPIFTTTPATATSIAAIAAAADDVRYDQPNSSYNSQAGKRLNLYQPMNETNIRHLLQSSNNPLNFPKRQKTPSLSTNNWPILSLPGLGRIPNPPSTHKQHINQQLQQDQYCSLDISKSTNINAPSTSSKSNEWKKEKRVYKMPRQGLNTEMYSWRYYGEKLIDGSPNPRKYYKCTFKDCAAKRRIKIEDSDPNMVIVKYSGRHNHLMPMFMDKSDVGARLDNNKLITSSETVSSTSAVFEKKENIDNIFDGLENIVDL